MPFVPRFSRSVLLLAPALFAAAACSRSPNSGVAPESSVRVAGAKAPITYGDCAEAERRLAADPDMTVDKVPAPLAMKPAPFQKVPPGAWNRDGSAVIKVEVMVDTTGRADMRTFKPVEVSHAWFTQNLKTVMPGWRFSPATVAGCKVRRVYRLNASVPARADRAKAAAAARPSTTKKAPARRP